MKIVLTDNIDLTPEHKQKITSLSDVTIYTDLPSANEIKVRIKDAEVITANWIDITEDILSEAANLKYIIAPTVGYDWIDVAAASKRNIKVLNCPTHNSKAVASLTIAMIFSLSRRLHEANAAMKTGEWNPTAYKGFELEGKTLGIIGRGRIGNEVASLAQSLGMHVQGVNSRSTVAEIDALVSSSDIVTLHAPLTEQSRNILDKRRLLMMKKGAYLINTARGAEVDQTALTEVLSSGHLAGAALDVFIGEPNNGIVPDSIMKLVSLPNVLTTPHMAPDTKERDERLGEELIKVLETCIANKPINVVNA
jgi:D-3-phosphoglycerate dehydrogenase / 2-oxoglutarate reductase